MVPGVGTHVPGSLGHPHEQSVPDGLYDFSLEGFTFGPESDTTLEENLKLLFFQAIAKTIQPL